MEITERNLLLFNLLAKTKPYLYCLIATLDRPTTEQIAFVTRSLFELNCITRYVLKDEENLKRFVAECIQDEIEIIEGLLELPEKPSGPSPAVLKNELVEMKAFAQNHNIVLQKPVSIKSIAKIVGVEKEYKAFYKLFCKYVHPSAYSINADSEKVHNSEIRVVYHFEIRCGVI